MGGERQRRNGDRLVEYDGFFREGVDRGRETGIDVIGPERIDRDEDDRRRVLRWRRLAAGDEDKEGGDSRPVRALRLRALLPLRALRRSEDQFQRELHLAAGERLRGLAEVRVREVVSDVG